MNAPAPLVMAATASSAFARELAAAGVDRIVAYHSSVYRQRGLPSVAGLLPWASANQQVLDALPGVLEGAGPVQVVATVCANDGLLDNEIMLDAVAEAGAVGVLNAPTVGLLSGTVRDVLEAEGLGMSAEIGLLAKARDRGLEAWAYVFDAEWTRAALDAGATGLVLHLGITGYPDRTDVSPAELAEQALAPLHDRPGPTPALVHGGPLRAPADARRLLAELPEKTRTLVTGVFGASAFEARSDRDPLTDVVRSWRRDLSPQLGQ